MHLSVFFLNFHWVKRFFINWSFSVFLCNVLLRFKGFFSLIAEVGSFYNEVFSTTFYHKWCQPYCTIYHALVGLVFKRKSNCNDITRDQVTRHSIYAYYLIIKIWLYFTQLTSLNTIAHKLIKLELSSLQSFSLQGLLAYCYRLISPFLT